jgi:hypothetical protein
MNKLNRFDRDNLNPVRDDMMSELAKVGEKFGIDFSAKGIRYTEGDFRVTIVAKIREKADGVLTKEERAYNIHRGMFNLPELGTSFRGSNGLTMTVVGWNTRARKYPVNLKGSDGKSYKNSAEMVARQF